jgi:predicted alpha/beta-hydrolase family hydrolase
VFLGYPLHAPGKPDQIRAEHLGKIRVPMLFLQGTKDPFARVDRLAPVVQSLGARARHVAIEGGDHSFNRSRKDDQREVGASLAPLACDFIREHT